LVTGVIAKIGPSGWAISVIPDTSSSEIIPTVLRFLISSYTSWVASTF